MLYGVDFYSEGWGGVLDYFHHKIVTQNHALGDPAEFFAFLINFYLRFCVYVQHYYFC